MSRPWRASLLAALLTEAHGHRSSREASELDGALPAHRSALAPLLAASAASAGSAFVPPRTERRGVAELRDGHLDIDDAHDAMASRFFFPPPVQPKPAAKPDARSRPVDAGYLGVSKPSPPELARVDVFNMRSDRAEAVDLPRSWAQRFMEFSVRCFDGFGSGEDFVGSANLLADASVEVGFSCWQEDDPATDRHRIFSKLEGIRDTGAILRQFAEEVHGDKVFFLTEPPGRSLHELIEEHRRQTPRVGESVVPMKVALPLWIDLLRSLVQLDWAGVALGDLQEFNVFVVDDGKHVVLVDLSVASVPSSKTKFLAGSGLDRTLCGDARRHAPEMVDGAPNDVANNVWQAGLIFAMMFFGHDDVPTAFLADGFDDADMDERKKIRQVIRENFSVQAIPGFDAAGRRYDGIQELFQGMLEKDLGRRLTAEQALKRVLRLAADLGVQVPAGRQPQPRPRELRDL
mmetsp:Transcript_67973/g.196938  ORF Transcript_67973/g.196938 Transcript_67973/m.196938 type:complete len:461 (+) Transcript_67973:46-1428(+)